MTTITLPIYWQQSGKKTVLVSMNAYRNWHYHTSNKFKSEFSELVLNQLDKNTKIPSPYQVRMAVFYKNTNCDASNIVALIEKVVLDVLQSVNIVENDSVKHHIQTFWFVQAQDKNNPRVEITITECTDEF